MAQRITASDRLQLATGPQTEHLRVLLTPHLRSLRLGVVVVLDRLTALATGADGFLIYDALYGFNAVLCAIAIGGLFFVLTTWLFLWPKASFGALQPVALADVTTAEKIRPAYTAGQPDSDSTSLP